MPDVTPMVAEFEHGARKVAGVVLSYDQGGVRAILLRRCADVLTAPLFDLPGGDLLPGEMPVPGMRRLFAESDPSDQGYAGTLIWDWLRRYPIVPCEGSIGVGFVLTARTVAHAAYRLISSDPAASRALVWCSLAKVRHWAPYCPDGLLALLIAATSPRTDGRNEQPIHETFIWPVSRAGLVRSPAAIGSQSDGTNPIP